MLGLMAEDELRNRSAVRMVLRWDELASRAKTTPTAVLGMLDILNSRGGLGRRGWDRLSPMVYAALDSATVRSSPQESWDFLFALNAKVEWSTAPAALADKLERAARSLARGAPEEALEAVEELHADVYGSAAVLNGVADGVAESPAFEALSECLSRLEPNVLLRLVAASDRLGEALVTAMNATADRWLDMVVRVLEGDDASARRRVRRRLVSLVDDAVAGKTVPRMLADVGGAELADLAVELGRRGRFRSEPINAALVEAARHTGSVDVVRDAVVSHVQSGDADAFLLKFVELTGPDLEWLLGLSDGGLAGRLLTALLADAEAMAIQSVLSQGGQAPRVVSVLRAVLPTSASEIARILQFGLMPSRAGLDVGFDVVSTVLPKERRSLEKWLLREVLSVARPGDSRVGQAIAEFRDRLTAEELVAAATAASIGPRRLSENLVALNGAPARCTRRCGRNRRHVKPTLGGTPLGRVGRSGILCLGGDARGRGCSGSRKANQGCRDGVRLRVAPSVVPGECIGGDSVSHHLPGTRQAEGTGWTRQKLARYLFRFLVQLEEAQGRST